MTPARCGRLDLRDTSAIQQVVDVDVDVGLLLLMQQTIYIIQELEGNFVKKIAKFSFQQLKINLRVNLRVKFSEFFTLIVKNFRVAVKPASAESAAHRVAWQSAHRRSRARSPGGRSTANRAAAVAALL